jgi:hypothetical protein
MPNHDVVYLRLEFVAGKVLVGMCDDADDLSSPHGAEQIIILILNVRYEVVTDLR